MRRLFAIVTMAFPLLFACTPEDNNGNGSEKTQDGGNNSSPSVTIGSEHISAISAVLAGKANLGSTVAADLQVGFQYSKSAGILPSNSKTVEATDADADYNYTASITGLDPATKYYFRSFVRQNGQHTYGETKEFTTKDVASLLETKDASEVEATKATLNAKLDLTDVLYKSITYGFYWGDSESAQNANLGGGEIKDNTYSASLTGLSHKTQYWYKSYVQLDSQTLYGEVRTFTTDIIPVGSVSLNKTEYTFNTIGNALTLLATVLPSNATDKSVDWSSDNEDVATVDAIGRVTATGNGIATITVTTKNQGKTATCVITVTQQVTSVGIDKKYLPLGIGDETTLSVIIYPDNAYDKSFTWTSSNSAIASVDNNGKVTAKARGNATIYATANEDSEKYSTCSVEVYRIDVPQAVDMGTVVAGKNIKWGSFNIGASSPEEYGLYYSWGETLPKSVYLWSTYKWCDKLHNSYETLTLTKYNTSSSFGAVDNKTVLDPEDDVAYVKLGNRWRIPTDAEWKALKEQCTWTWTTQNGIKGYKVTATNGNSIFLPSAGDRTYTSLFDAGSNGYYWSSSLHPDDPRRACEFDFVVDEWRQYSRSGGLSVRPVCEK